MNPALLDSKRAAALVGVGYTTLRHWVTAGHLAPAARGPGRNGPRDLFRPEDVLACSEARKAVPQCYRRARDHVEPTEAELDALIRQQRQHLPPWWSDPDEDA